MPLKILIEPDEILRNYILYPDLDIHDPLPDVLPRIADETNLYHLPSCPASTTLIPQRDYVTGKILDFVEVPAPDAGCDARNSMSLRRAPGPVEEATRGSIMNFPFWPGGFEPPEKSIESLEINNFDFENNLLSVPPGFSKGLQFEGGKPKAATEEYLEMNKTVNLLDALHKGHKEFEEWLKSTEEEVDANKEDENKDIVWKIEKISDDNLIAADQAPVLSIANVESTRVTSLEWAEMIDISHPVNDFYEKIPDMAITYPFELDDFQKQAILLLEERKHVFVAAHTSAGKTVVAEYAIALSQNHMTKTIYTSPIKALSNQKYRDFKEKFKDVGLITGDLQIDPTASCLIMTTEILRSMLYCGSDSTRDLEYVIFDEVHYINNAERGHVWEEVLILLPEHVNIIMLSATVPNTLEFANWVGHTKKKKVYVISTLKRPVPLMHYLYTGCGGKSKNDIFLIVNETGEFLSENYRLAVAKKEASSKKSMNRGPPNHKQDQTLWVGLVDHLKRNDKLPVVAFTLSRKRCDSNAAALQSCDLNTGKEKSLVCIFFQQCLQRLKPPDRILPQVTTMQSSLERGIGIHHSGILPILKEIVEMLFQRGLVKLLFATETFAMGVNMPARTVIFDSHFKYDGNEKRMLEPAEYIQMAGRAGRRGHDATGTVILLCKGKMPLEFELRSLILGRPMRLESRFLLTYAMILTCLRFENVTVEDIMSHSFKEFAMKQKRPETEKQLQLTQDKISTLKELDPSLQPFCTFYDVALAYRRDMDRLMSLVISQPRIAKELKPGRVLIISQRHYYNRLAILLSVVAQQGKDIAFKVLVLDNATKPDATIDIKESSSSTNILDRGELWHKMLSLTPQYKQFYPDSVTGHAVLVISPCNIVEITKTNLKVEAELILRNWETRQIPRFKDSPPGPSVVKSVQDLHALNSSYNENPNTLQFVNLTQEVNIKNTENTDMNVLESLASSKRLLKDIIPYTNITNFEDKFAVVFDRKNLENKLADLQFSTSKKSLQLYPDYCNKLQVLRALNYIDDQDEVTIKGNVACGMGQNELIITELVLCNIFTALDTAEIAALLSSLVFQAKTNVTPILTDRLKEGMLKIIEVDNQITEQEKIYHVTSIEAKTRLNFGLVQVVYEWAKNKPFAEIMELTDIQEGIIVRCIQQLDETLRDVKTAAMRIGNPALQNKMDEASNTIKRDIVFTAILMNDFDNYEVRKIKKRIEIKRANLRILLPEITFLRFIEELEKFQQLIEGVDADGPSQHVQLPLARLRFESLQNSYKELLTVLTENASRVDQCPSEVSLKNFFEAVHESSLFLITCFRNFCSQIVASSQLVYNIRAIVSINELLSDLKEDISTVRRNFYNFQKSTTKRQVKETLTNIYASALAASSFKFEYLSRTFPRLGPISTQKLRFLVNANSMSEDASKAELKIEAEETADETQNNEREDINERENNDSVEDRQEAGFEQPVNEKAEEEKFPDNQETSAAAVELSPIDVLNDIQPMANAIGENTVTDQQPELVSLNAETTNLQPDVRPSNIRATLSIVQIEDEIRNELRAQKNEFDHALVELQNYEMKINELNNELQQQKRTFKHDMEEMEKHKKAIAENTELTDEEKTKQLQDAAVQIGQLTGANEEIFQNLENQKEETKGHSLAYVSKLNELKNSLFAMKQEKMDNLQAALVQAADDLTKEKILKTMDIIETVFVDELEILGKIEAIENFGVDDHGVYYFDKANMKTYVTAMGEAKQRESAAANSEVKDDVSSKIASSIVSKASTPKVTDLNAQDSESQMYREISATKSTTGSIYSSTSLSEAMQKDQLPLDSENYIKSMLGKPLRQGLAAITVYQPSDPINYLANFLLQYRYNELRNIQRQQDFENLVVERERFAHHTHQIEQLRHEQLLKPCDPCNRNKPGNI